ncbi:ABC transporter ATP-binding protein [Alkaliphilus peptidifermentans]|uniref:Fluoroquinolone transport system ATP-binding protein n=1 Tax=Alkaliphilus peptidifermentans DSM 18978 TaxID=1120976 RepID=A0A1G5LEJ3_9FIRM|nr:ABC transporter ATP-binding protein [Alkaliphilus peptidifermentans]SCZ10718.1 fluoroquinolone transport system ATP-binding protein [Alkaliphilus peptidifermentans DSM 18978]
MIKVSGLEFSYEKATSKVIKGIDFRIKKGEILGFLGPSGAGKTTTQRIIIGLLQGYRGSVEIMGKERREWGQEFYEKIGVAFDFPNLYLKLTAVENLQLIASYYQKKPQSIDLLLERVGLLPDRDKKVEGFSKGMKMRLNFIRSLLHDPELLFFDEPTSGLDPLNAKIIKDMILELKAQGKTIFLTTHNMTVAEQLCDKVAFIVEGAISVIDSPNELKVKYGTHTMKIEYYDGDRTRIEEFHMTEIKNNQRVFEILKTKNIKTIHSQEATLEDIFIKLTGRELI